MYSSRKRRRETVLERSDLSAGYEVVARWDPAALPRFRSLQPTVREIDDACVLDAATTFEELWSLTRHLSLIDVWRAKEIHRRWASVQHLNGDAIECGVFRGGVSLLLALALYLAGSTKRIHMCDTFAGLPAPDRRFDRAYVEGSMVNSQRALQTHIRALGLQAQCVVHKGLFSETFKKMPQTQRFNFAHIDCDLFHGTAQCLEFFEHRMDPGAVIVVDDYYDESHGVMRAVNRFAERTGTVVHLGTPAQAVLVIGETSETTRAKCEWVTIGSERVCFSTARLQRIAGLEKYYRGSLAVMQDRAAHLATFIETIYGSPSNPAGKKRPTPKTAITSRRRTARPHTRPS